MVITYSHKGPNKGVILAGLITVTDRFVLPTVVVSWQCNTSITQACFLRKTDLRNSCHVNDITTPAPKQKTLRLARKPRSLNRDSSSFLVTLQLKFLGSFDENGTCFLAEWCIHLYVADPSGATWFSIVKRKFTFERSVDKLVQDDDIPRVDVLPQRPTSCGSYHMRTALLLQSMDVRTKIDE